MDEDEIIDDALFVTLTLNTHFIRVIDSTLIPARVTIKTDVSPREDADQEELLGAITKIKYWLEHIVSRSIAFSADNDMAIAMLVDEQGKNRSGNRFMLTPGDPTDEVLATLFQCKMTALANGVAEFGFVEITTDNELGMTFTFSGDGKSLLPTVGQWIGERSYFNEPWWMRNDASTLDVMVPDGADPDEKPAWAFSLDTLIPAKHDAEVVIHPFKPTIIDGGKGDE